MIKLSEKIGYGFGDMSSSMFWKIFGAYLMIFYTDVYGLSAAVVGTMFAVTRIWDSFFDPVVGAFADRTETRWGKFRPYLLFLAIPFGVIGTLTFITPPMGPTGKIVYAYATYTLMMMVYSGINVPYASLLGVMSPHPADRNVLSTFRMMFAYLGSFVALLLFMPLANAFGAGDKSDTMVGWMTHAQFGWFAAVAVISVACVLLFFGCFLLTRERVKTSPGAAHTPLKADASDLLHNKPWWILLGAGVSSLVFNSIRDGATVYYFKYYIDETAFGSITFLGIPFVLSGLYLAVGQAANIVGVILAAPVSNRIGKRRTFMLAMAVATVLSLAFYLLGRDQLVPIFVLQVLISICAGSVFPLLWSMYADCSDYSELKTGNRATGLIFSSSSMSQKLGWAIGTALTGWLLEAFGFVANGVQTDATVNGIRMFLSVLPAAGALLSLIFIALYPLSESKMLSITIELEKRRKCAAE
jgi:GPH family glycoside/pentoside/hexuronide:cation symporter